jgi:cytochrome c oxidase assembly protein subunit 15
VASVRRRAGARPGPLPPGWPLVIFGVLTTLALFAVVLLGFVDTATNSALGCGRSFPLCNGALLPDGGIHALIEWSHRVLAAVAGLMVGALAIWAWVRAWRLPAVRFLGLIALGFIFIESTVGALAVLSPESQALIAIHLGIALTAFAATALLTACLWAFAARGGPWPRRPVPRPLGAWIWVMLVYMYLAVYLGAYVAGTGSGAACLTWPLCTRPVTLSLANPVTIDTLHRLAAVVAGVLGVVLAAAARRHREARPDLGSLGAAIAALVVLQIASGLLLVSSGLALWATILHVGLVTLLFTTSAGMALLTLV